MRALPGKTLQRFSSLGSKSRITAASEPKRGQPLQRFPSLPPKIKNHCTNEGNSRQNLAVILKSGSEIKNHCSPWAKTRATSAAIPKFTPLKSRITAQMRAIPGKTLQRFSSLALKSRIDARWLCDYDLQAKPFSVATKKISIGRGPHCRYDRSRRNHLLDCFQLLVLVLIVLVYLPLKP